MTTAVRRKKPTTLDPVSTFVEHLNHKNTAATFSTRADALKKRLKEWFFNNPRGLYKNENGSIFYDLPETVEVGGTAYKGMELRRSVSTKFDEEEAEKVVKRKDLWEEATVRVIDQEAIYRLVAEGKITERELDSMFEESESYAFWPVKGEVI